MTLMLETSVILPQSTKLSAFEDALIANFGGYTVVLGRGGWKSSTRGNIIEPIAVYTVAAAWTRHDQLTLRMLVQSAHKALDQECVYVRWPDGVEFVA